MFHSSDELWLWFRQGQLTIESIDSDLDKVLVTYSQVDSNQFELLVTIKAIVLHCNYYLITFFLMKSFTSARNFCTISLFNC